jgi:hypothetical protein
MDTRLWNAVDRRLLKLDIKGAVKFLEERLANEKMRRFKGLIGREFGNNPRDILSAINRFIATCSKKLDVRAVYLEMNGFDINPDRWYFDSFAYDQYGAEPRNTEWLCHWKHHAPGVTLTGLEPVQADFKWYDAKEIWKDESYTRAHDLANLLVMSKFVALVQTALGTGKLSKPIPILATAHEFDILGRFEG